MTATHLTTSPTSEAPDQARLLQQLLRLEKQVLRVTSLRATDPQEKFDADSARELYAWIVPAILKFQGERGAVR